MKFHYCGHPRYLDEDDGVPNKDHSKNLELVEMIVEKSLDFDISLNVIDRYRPDHNVIFHFAFANG